VYDDFKEQILLPHKMSQFGPALAVADINGDALDDVFVGAATGFEAKVFFQTSSGDFKLSNNNIFEKDKVYEDIDAVFFDVDNDGDKDLYVVSGGNEFEKGDVNYKDRLYINNGKGIFTKSNNNLPNISGSVVLPFDFDKDGDIDLFVGGRHVPHQYPLPATSKLLENIKGKLVDVTDQKASQLNKIGMVTDALWSDYDADGDADLILVGEWMSITIFSNEGGIFKRKNIPSLEKTKGWWFSIDQGDFDKDGDIDFVVGNLGLNYKYKTNPQKPFDVYYDDFDHNGKKDIVLGYYNFGKHYPVRGFSCSSQQVPKLKKDIKKYNLFASMEIKDIYGDEKLSNSLHYTVDTFETSLIKNIGNGQFKVIKLPIEAQFSNVNDFIIDDFNVDGNLDILLAGNLFVSEIETTKNDGGTGLLLLGAGNNSFTTKRFMESGFFARKDVKKIKSLKTKKGNFILVANNNDFLQLFRINE